MVWLKWFPWRFIIRRIARAHGFLDPISLLARLRRFAQPSEVHEPIELLRAGVALHARGLLNNRILQHNLDWVWPYWVERQFDPKDDAFIPRAFSFTLINLTHRNWAAMDIPENAFVVGHVGRLAPEKNLEFLSKAITGFFKTENRAHFLIVGRGPSENAIREIFSREGMADRLHATGVLKHPLLASGYRAMDVFAFASKSETQGMVLTEAMAAGVPVVALDAPGAREVVVDHRNGRLLHSETIEEFSSALQWVAALSSERMRQLKQDAENTAEKFSMVRSADKALTLYKNLLDKEFFDWHKEYSAWTTILHKIKTEWDVIKSLAGAAGAALNIDVSEGKRKP